MGKKKSREKILEIIAYIIGIGAIIITVLAIIAMLVK